MAFAPALRRPWSQHPPLNRWIQLVSGVVLMMALGGLLFAWPLLRGAPGASVAETLTASENAFAAFIFTETIFVPLEARLGDRIPRWLLVGAGAALVVLGAIAGARAATTQGRLAWYVLGGAGAGLAYGGTIAKALKRFTDRKALCVGVTAAAVAGVLVLAVLANLALSSSASIPVLIVLGAGQGVVILFATLLILDPPPPPPPSEWRA